MYNNLMFGMKRRLLYEIESAFLNHPQFSGKVQVKNKFPYQERLQFGVLLRNTSGSQIRMSADNYMADLYSHVRLARNKYSPGTSIEWVRENASNVTTLYTEDLSAQVDPTQRLFTTAYQMVAGAGNTQYANNTGQITIKLNGIVVYAPFVDGENKTFFLGSAPAKDSIVTVSYFIRNIAAPGMYQAIFNSDHDFSIYPTYEIKNETIVKVTTGVEVSETLHRAPIGKDSERIYLHVQNEQSSDVPILLSKGINYTLDNTTGIITFLNPIAAGYRMSADYYTEVASEQGPFTFKPYQEIHTAIPGVILCMGRRAVQDDKQLVIVSQNQEPQARIYGGHWDMSLSLAIISKDSIQVEEMTDQLVNWLWCVRKNQMEIEGITLNRVEPTGETEESFIESTGDVYFETSVDISVMTEWQKFDPYIYSIRGFDILLNVYEPDKNVVITAPSIGYERVS